MRRYGRILPHTRAGNYVPAQEHVKFSKWT